MTEITRNSIQHLVKVIAVKYRNSFQIFTTSHITIGNYKKKTKSKLSADALSTCSNNLYAALSIWNVGRSSQKFANGCRALTGCLRSYSDYLSKATERMSLARASPQQEINFTLPNPMEVTNQISESYQAIDNVVRDLPLYE